MSIASKILCVIPARMNSDRIPFKNLRMLGNISILQHTINCAEAAGLAPVVSTEKEWVERVSERIGKTTRVMPRSDEAAKATADISQAVAEISANWKAEYVVVLQPAVLARNERMLLDVVRYAMDNDCSCVTVADMHPFIWSHNEATLINEWTPNRYPRSQDVKRYVEINSVQVCKIKDAVDGKRWSTPLALAVMPGWTTMLDIDTWEHLDVVNDLWQYLQPRLQTMRISEFIKRDYVNGGSI